MSEVERTLCLMSAELMKGLIAKGEVKPGSDMESWNEWCIKKARVMMTAAFKEVRGYYR